MTTVYTPNEVSLSNKWLKKSFGTISSYTPITGDAGHRQYTRIAHHGKTAIWVKDNQAQSLAQFLSIHHLLQQHHCPVPKIHDANTDHGWLLLEDLGSKTLLSTWAQASTHELHQTVDLITQMSSIPKPSLPMFDIKHMIRELHLCRDWYFGQITSPLSDEETAVFNDSAERLAALISQQPFGFIHLDFHSANLMLHQQQLYMIDFQDAKWGPTHYDITSLLFDCYTDWPPSKRAAWIECLQQSQPYNEQWVNEIALQRLIKVLGIFSRLKHRDHKPRYTQYYPRMYGYLQSIFKALPTFSPLEQLFKDRQCW